MGDACRTFETPVTGGNVSFYNENPEGAVFPTPTIGMLGLIEDIDRDATSAGFGRTGDVIYLLTPSGWMHQNNIDGSEYLSWIHDKTLGDAPHFHLLEEKAVQQAMLQLIQAGTARHAHDISDGGLAVCLAESAIFSDGLGADIQLAEFPALRLDAVLFGEAQSRIVFSAAPESTGIIADLLKGQPVEAHQIGFVKGERFVLRYGQHVLFDCSQEDLKKPYETAIPRMMGAS
jgi:phosphoribosylformylglycinamidine synthase